MKKLNNDRGAALIYVLMLLTTLAFLSPVLLKMASSQTMATEKTSYDKKATQYLYGAMDAFIVYLKQYPADLNESWESYFSAFPRFLSNPTEAIVIDGQRYEAIRLPDGDTLLYCLAYEKPIKNGENEVTMTVIAGDWNQNGKKDEEEPFFVKRELTYSVILEYGGVTMPIGSLEGGSDNFIVLDDIEHKIQRVKPERFDYEVDSIHALIEKMNEAKDREDGHYTFKLNLTEPFTHTSQPWLNIDFSEEVIGEGKAYIVYATRVDQNGNEKPISNNDSDLLTLRFFSWKMRGMLIVNGGAHAGNQVGMEINNVLVNGSYEIQGGGQGNTSYRGYFEVKSKDIKGNPVRSGSQSSGQYYNFNDSSQAHWSFKRER